MWFQQSYCYICCNASFTEDEVKLLKRLTAAMNKLADMKFVRKFQDEPEAWEIRRFLKARVSIDQLEGLKHQLELALQMRQEDAE